MTSTTNAIAPVTQKQRISSLDILRGIALLGILLINIVSFGLPSQAHNNPIIIGQDTELNVLVWGINSMFFEGTMRAIFSMLFGAGVILFISKAEEKGVGIKAADYYYRRVLWLLFFGMLHAYAFLWPGDILYAYGLMGLFLFPFRNASPKLLIAAACVLFLVGAGVNHREYSRLSKLKAKAVEAEQSLAAGRQPGAEQLKAQEEWQGELSGNSPEALKAKIAVMNKGYLEMVRYLVPLNERIQSLYTYRFKVWDIMSMMFMGMALFKLGLFSAKKSYRFYLLLGLIGYAVGLTVNYLEIRMIINSNFDLVTLAGAERSYHLGRIFTVLGHISLIMIFCKLPVLRWLKHSFASVGRMAFTNYVMHTVICNIIFLGIGFGLYGQLERYELYYVVAGVWVLQMAISPLWLKYFRFGPLEWAWRSLTYHKLQPLRQKKANPQVVLGGAVGG